MTVAMCAALAAASASPASAAVTTKKSIWGPAEVEGKSQFPIYRDLGVGIYQTRLSWAEIAPTRPRQPRDAADLAYRWPAELDAAIREGRRYGIKVSVQLNGAPGWANGNRPSSWAPSRPEDFAGFAAAAARRYPAVRDWMVWNEPSKATYFQPLARAEGRGLSRRQRRGPQLYARILDAAYGALKRVNRRNVVIGGNTWTGGEVSPFNFIRAMRLPSGRRPRMDLYGHNPFTARSPDLGKAPLRFGFADFSDLDTLMRWLDGYGYRASRGRRLRLFLSEFVIPTDHRNLSLNFWVSRRTQANWLRAALRITRRSPRIHSLGWLDLYDESPRPDGLETNSGLLDWRGRRKPSYYAYRRG